MQAQQEKRGCAKDAREYNKSTAKYDNDAARKIKTRRNRMNLIVAKN